MAHPVYLLTGPYLFASNWTPAKLSGLKLWLDATQIASLNDGDPVATWSDASGNGNDASQATASKRPLYKTNIRNGKPVVRFDGTDDFMDAATLSASQPITHVIVLRILNQVGLQEIFYDGITNRNLLRKNGGGDAIWQYAGNDTQVLNPPATAWHIYTSVFNGASSFTRQDGVSGGTFDVGAQGISGLRIAVRTDGTTGPVNGDIAEIISTNTQMNASEISHVESYLATKWGITI